MSTQFKPILFSTPMVQAIIEGRKTQTRRVLKPQPPFDADEIGEDFGVEQDGCMGYPATVASFEGNASIHNVKSPYGNIGDVLWVREKYISMIDCETNEFAGYWYYADMPEKFHKEYKRKWRPSIHMPKDACRLFLRVKDVRVEKLSDISNEDSVAEGCSKYGPFNEYQGSLHPNGGSMRFRAYSNPVDAFKCIWESINGEDSWKCNPWVWVIEFERVEKPTNF